MTAAVMPLADRVLVVAGRSLPLPCFFPSISSVKANLRPVDYLEVLAAVGEPQFLVSTYDVAHASDGERTRIDAALRSAASSGSVLLLDSGNYESYWHRDRAWTSTAHRAVLAEVPAHLGFCFDDQAPPGNPLDAAKAIEEAIVGEQGVFGGSIVPIVHGTELDMAERVRAVVRTIRPSLVAVPERELGAGIIKRVASVKRLRK